MIIPPNTRFRLDPRDEYTHEPEPVPNYNESAYFSAFDTPGGAGVWMRLGNRVNEGHAEMTVCVYLPDGSVGFMYRRAQIEHNREMNAGGLAFEVVEPFKRLRAAYEGDLLILANPYDMANPSVAFKTNPVKPASLALEFTGVSPMYGGELVALDGTPLRIDPEKSVFRGHTEQNMAVTGHITVDGQRYPINGFGYRDKSWGPRHWHNFHWYRWLPITFNADFGLLLSINGRPDDVPHVSGNVLTNGRFEPIIAIDMETEWDEHTYPRKLQVRFETAQQAYELSGTARALIPLRHRSPAGSDPNIYTRITEGLMDYHCNGHHAIGMAEYCDVMINGEPISRKVAARGRSGH